MKHAIEHLPPLPAAQQQDDRRGGPRAVAELYSAAAAHVGLVQRARVGGGERVCLVGA